MIFRRRLSIGLSDGKAIVSERDFEIRFLPLTDGYRIEGGEIARSLEAPQGLEAYARLESERREEGMFPLLLDERGLIRSGPEAVSSLSLARAVEIALEQVAAGLQSRGDVAEARGFILGLQQAASAISSTIPADLFVPPGTVQHASRSIALPDGASGVLTTEYSGRIAPETGMLEEARRVIVSEVGGTRRETVETWILKDKG